MKKLLSTLPSTRPDQLCLSQSSEVEAYKPVKLNFTNKLELLLSSFTQVIKIRSVLLHRDIEAIYNQHQEFLSQLLEVQNHSQLWELVADRRDTELDEDKQISLLVKVLQRLNQKRLAAADEGNSYLSDQFRKIVEWFINEIVKYESIVAMKKESQALSKLSQKGKLRRLSYQDEQRKVVESFEEGDKARQERMLDRFKRQQQFRQKEVSSKINEEIYKINPSTLLRQAKAKSLVKKLGPYRMNKVNPYQDTGYAQDINQTLHAEQTRRMAVIDHFKKVEKQKLLRSQWKLFETQQMHWEHQRSKMHTTLDKGRSELQNNEQKLKENMMHSFEVSRKRKLRELKKTLEAYVKHEDSIKIKEILVDHEEKVRHTNDFKEIALSQRMLKHMPSRYSTICGKTDFSAENQTARHGRYFQSKIYDIMKEENGQKQVLTARKSLVDMYDNSLTLV